MITLYTYIHIYIGVKTQFLRYIRHTRYKQTEEEQKQKQKRLKSASGDENTQTLTSAEKEYQLITLEEQADNPNSPNSPTAGQITKVQRQSTDDFLSVDAFGDGQLALFKVTQL